MSLPAAPVGTFGQFDIPGLEVELPATRRDLTNKIAIIQGCHGMHFSLKSRPLLPCQ